MLANGGANWQVYSAFVPPPPPPPLQQEQKKGNASPKHYPLDCYIHWMYANRHGLLRGGGAFLTDVLKVVQQPFLFTIYCCPRP